MRPKFETESVNDLELFPTQSLAEFHLPNRYSTIYQSSHSTHKIIQQTLANNDDTHIHANTRTVNFSHIQYHVSG